MATDEQIKIAKDVLYQAVSDIQVKLRWGTMQRANILKTQEKGISPTGYRVDFLRTARAKVLLTLIQAAKEFNAKYKHDQASTRDCVDILELALTDYKKACKEQDEAEEEEDEYS